MVFSIGVGWALCRLEELRRCLRMLGILLCMCVCVCVFLCILLCFPSSCLMQYIVTRLYYNISKGRRVCGHVMRSVDRGVQQKDIRRRGGEREGGGRNNWEMANNADSFLGFFLSRSLCPPSLRHSVVSLVAPVFLFPFFRGVYSI